jgi:hypothetical protein
VGLAVYPDAMNKVGGLDDPVWTLPSGDKVDEGRPSWRSRVLVVGFLAVLGLGVVYPATAVVLSRKDYGTFAFWKLPNRIDYCGRRYYDQGPQPGSPALFESQNADRSARWTFLSWTFSGRSIYADVSQPRAVHELCTMMLSIPIGGGKWEMYALSGGP